MNTAHPLSRRGRPTTFDTIIGQDLPVRLLKNSLYVGSIFPVYLLSGMRGSGKTTTARVFAAALNCVNRESFQQDPKQYSLPCGACDSCRAMAASRHPDFIEIDAASYTGVDNIRDVIESASFVPVLGKTKIYLIDEAHMLSKAACNALLKVLEEPPHSALFMLATTDADKIIDTVRSRSFRLFFQPVDSMTLGSHLKAVCDREQINYEEDALAIIARESEGSVRDALNTVERIRLAGSLIAKEAVYEVLSEVPEAEVARFIDAIIAHDEEKSHEALATLKGYEKAPAALWKRLVIVARDRMWDAAEKRNGKTIQSLLSIVKRLYEVERLFLRSSAPTYLLESLLFSLLYGEHEPSNVPISAPIKDDQSKKKSLNNQRQNG